jgi:uncharacterized RDD family membrane protein YckC
MTESPNDTQKKTQGPPNSTLIEFPGVNRNRPAWRKELSERVREIQQRRAREAEIEAEERRLSAPPPELSAEATEFAPGTTELAPEASAAASAEVSKQLGLVPTPEAPEMNPLVVAALRRIERARAQTTQAPRHGRAQAAAARVIEEEYERENEAAPARPAPPRRPSPVPAAREEDRAVARSGAAEPAAKTATAHTPSTLSVVAAPTPQTQATPARPVGEEGRAGAETKTTPRRVAASGATETPVGAPPETGAPTRTEAGGEAVAPSAEVGPALPAAPVAAHAPTTAPAKADAPVAKTVAAPAPQASAPTAAPTPVAAAASPNVATAEAEARPQPRKVAGVIDDHWLERRGVDLLPKVETVAYDDRAPFPKRIGAALFDLLVVAFLCAPFAAVIELTIGRWEDARVLGSMGGVVALVTFLYHTCAVALAGRTWGMRLFSLHTVDADTASVPTTWQCARRAFVYTLSLAALGLFALYALLDAEGRTLHDLASRTAVVKE